MIKTNIRSALVFLVSMVILVPRFPVMPLGYGELSIRIDGVMSALAGVAALYYLRSRLVILPIFILAFLYSQGSGSFLISIGFFFQVMSILLLPILFNYFAKKDLIFRDQLLYKFEHIIVWYGVVNVIVSVVFRYLQLEVCFDSATYTGCIGMYGLLDRPYVFAVYIGVGFVLLCSRKNISMVTTLVFLYGLSISDSRSIAGILLVMGIVVFLKNHNVSFFNLLSLIFMGLVLWGITTFGGGKVSLNNLPTNEVDPSWLMRLDNIDRYMDWVDLQRSLFGNGTLAFYEFAEQYGVPGPMDNLYFRVVSEIGIVGGTILLVLFLYPLFQVAKIRGNKILFLFYVTLVLCISIFQESLVAPRSGHVLVLLGIYLTYFSTVDPSVKTIMHRV